VTASVAPVLRVEPAPPLGKASFDERLATREARLGIVGLGYAGLPLAMLFAETGFRVTGIGLNEGRVRAVNERRSYLVHVPPDHYGAATAS
jgi:UDP-N-acetyl-D-glucosamine dehydrogenase